MVGARPLVGFSLFWGIEPSFEGAALQRGGLEVRIADSMGGAYLGRSRFPAPFSSPPPTSLTPANRVTSLSLSEKCCFLASSAAGNPTHYMIEQAFAQAELDWRFLSFEVAPENLADALTGLQVLGFRGVKLDGPFRSPAAEWLPTLTDRARRSGVVNCLTRIEGQLVGDDTLGAAFIEAMAANQGLAGKEVVVIGSGRDARSIACAACEGAAAVVHLVGEQGESVDRLAQRIAASMADTASETEVVPMEADNNLVHLPTEASIVAFAPAGGDESPQPVIDTEGIGQQKLTFVDTRLRGSRTGLLRFAAELGALEVDGVDLAAREAALALETWTNLEFDRAPLRESAEEFLGI